MLPLQTAPSYKTPRAMERIPEIVEGVELRLLSPAPLQQGRVLWGMLWSIPPLNLTIGGAESSGFMGVGVHVASQEGLHFASRFLTSFPTPGASSSSAPQMLIGMFSLLRHLSSLCPLILHSLWYESRSILSLNLTSLALVQRTVTIYTCLKNLH